ncbi:hypothetical protein GCM10009838_43080 [Catenulispora subtropica]|uniref:Secreted protein n=1 Tax=Catenulispora subtropica TaxID=450798 RepID=A0ABN2RZU4_9ACTN
MILRMIRAATMIATIVTTSVTIVPELLLNQFPTPFALSLSDVVGGGEPGVVGLSVAKAVAKAGTAADTGFGASLIPLGGSSNHPPD